MDGTKNKKEAGPLITAVANKLKANKKLELAVYIGLGLLVVALYLSTLLPKDTTKTSADKDAAATSQTVETAQEVETRLESVLSHISGAGRVEVMITYESGPELVTAMNTDTNTNRSQSAGDGKQSSTEQKTESQKPATVNGGNGTEPIVITEKQPAVRGVIVVAEGAGNIAVKLSLQRAVQTVLDVPAASIEVFEMEAGAQK